MTGTFFVPFLILPYSVRQKNDNYSYICLSKALKQKNTMAKSFSHSIAKVVKNNELFAQYDSIQKGTVKPS